VVAVSLDILLTMATTHLPQQDEASLADDLRSPTLTSFLDMARWMAAAMVFVAHLRNPLFLGYGDVPATHRTLGIQAWYFLTGWHAEAVTVFFVLSGLLVGAAGIARVQSQKFDPYGYAIDRATRLFLPFIPALLLGYLLDVTGSRIFADVGFWNATQPMIAQKVNSPAFDTLLGFDVLAGNALMLQHYLVPPVGSNQPLWSISAEFWFYVLFLFLTLGFVLCRGAGSRFLVLLSVLAICALLGGKFLILLGLWVIGAAIGYAPPGRWRNPAAALLLFVAILVVSRTAQSFFDVNTVSRELKNYAVAFAFAYLVVCMRGRHFPWLERVARINGFLAGFSFSLYLLHFPLMLFVLGALHASGSFDAIATGFDPSDLKGIAIYLLTIGIVLAVSWLFSLGTEQRTESVRRALKRRWLPPAHHRPHEALN
jgi:peptidoglycan/LPS O-acetylase OafA/YrhL